MAGVEGAREKVVEVGSERLVVQNLHSGGSCPELRVGITRGAFTNPRAWAAPHATGIKNLCRWDSVAEAVEKRRWI